jgi:hypothetical protein
MTGDEKLDPVAVSAMCRASADALRADRRAERDFEDAAAASQQGGWDQGLAPVEARVSSGVAERDARSQQDGTSRVGRTHAQRRGANAERDIGGNQR